MGEHDLVGLAHEGDVAREPPLPDVAQVRHVVGALAAEPVAVGPDAQRSSVEQHVGLGAEHDRDVDVDGLPGGRPAAAPLDRRDALDQLGDVHHLQRVGLEREDAAVDGAVEAQEQIGEPALARACGGSEHHQSQLGALHLAQPSDHVALPPCDPATVERHPDPDAARSAHSDILQPRARRRAAAMPSGSIRRAIEPSLGPRRIAPRQSTTEGGVAVRRRRLQLAAVVAVMGVLGVVAAAVAGGGSRDVREHLTGYEETPLTLSTSGFGEFRARVRDGEIPYRLSYGQLEGNITQAHIHLGREATSGGISVFLCSNLGNGPAGTQACPAGHDGTVDGTIVPADVIGPDGQGIALGEFDELARAIRAGATYVNVHTDKYGSGEIRAQLERKRHR